MIIALIPARAGSKGVADKNITEIGGLPLLAYSVITAKKIKKVDLVVVSSDSYKYLRIAERFGASTILRRKEAATDTAGDEMVVKDFVEQYGGKFADLVVYLRPTTPFREPNILSIAIQEYLKAAPDKRTSLRSIEEMSESAYKCLQVVDGELSGVFGLSVEDAGRPRQSFPETYKPNGYVDIIDPVFFQRTGLLWGNHVLPFYTGQMIEIDTAYDLCRAVRYITAYPETIKFYKRAAREIRNEKNKVG